MIVVGEAGIGKSHFAKELSARMAFENRIVYLNIEDAVSIEVDHCISKSTDESKKLMSVDELKHEIKKQRLSPSWSTIEQISADAEGWIENLCSVELLDSS